MRRNHGGPAPLEVPVEPLGNELGASRIEIRQGLIEQPEPRRPQSQAAESRAAPLAGGQSTDGPVQAFRETERGCQLLGPLRGPPEPGYEGPVLGDRQVALEAILMALIGDGRDEAAG